MAIKKIINKYKKPALSALIFLIFFFCSDMSKMPIAALFVKDNRVAIIRKLICGYGVEDWTEYVFAQV